jgi:hypothetical protein
MGQNKNKKHSYFEYRVGGRGGGRHGGPEMKGHKGSGEQDVGLPTAHFLHDPTELQILEHLQQTLSM